MEPVLIGYFPKSISLEPSFPGMEGVYSVSGCCSRGPAGWVDLWRHNEMAVYDSDRVAEEVLRDAFTIDVTPDPAAAPPWKVTLSQAPFPNGRMLAYKVFPVHFLDDGDAPLALPELRAEPLSDAYERLGCDPVEYLGEGHLGFGCSPLSCNGRAGDVPVNRYCLIDDAGLALAQAREMARSKGTKGEPGPYVVIEVWRRRGPVLERPSPPAVPAVDPALIRHAIRGPLGRAMAPQGKIGG